MDALSKMRKPGLTLQAVEGAHILRDPPSSIHTRKKERVEAGDITHHIREREDRISENIRRYATGVNPMLGVSYSNRGGGSKLTSITSVGNASNPYKVVKDGAFRPPMFRQEELLPISRQKRKWTVGRTNAAPGYQKKIAQETHIDFTPLKATVYPRSWYNIGGKQHGMFTDHAILDPLTYEAITSLKGTSRNITNDTRAEVKGYTSEKPLTSYTTPGFSVQVFDKTTRSLSEIKLPEKKLQDIVATAAKGGHIKFDGPNGQTIKLKDYTWTVYQTPKNTNKIVLETTNPDIDLSRNTPLTHVNSNIRARIANNPEVMQPILENNRPVVSAQATPGMINGVTPTDGRDVNIYAKNLYKGGYDPKPTIVPQYRQDMTPTLYNTFKARLNQ